MLITIDGPAGVGKNTVCDILAKRLGMLYLNSGSLYRVLGLLSLKSAHPLETGHLLRMLPQHRIDVRVEQGSTRFFLDDQDVTETLQTPDVSHAASVVSRDPELRGYVNMLLTSFFDQDVIIDGRDAGTHIAPQAEYKFYLDATPETRAQRRYEQLRAKHYQTTYEDVLRQTQERDAMDANKGKYSLQIPEGAVRIATDTMTAYDVVDHILPSSAMTTKKRSLWIGALLVLALLGVALWFPGSGLLSTITGTSSPVLMQSSFTPQESWTGSTLLSQNFETGSGMTLSWQTPLVLNQDTTRIGISGDIVSTPVSMIRIELVDSNAVPVMRKVLPMMGPLRLEHDFTLEHLITSSNKPVTLTLIFPPETELQLGNIKVEDLSQN